MRHGHAPSGRYQGKFGQIDIVEREDDGTRIYLEEGIYQSKATRAGELPFQYVRPMAGILKRSTNVLLLGCGGGTLATLLVKAGKAVNVVDHNPISFQIAHYWTSSPRRRRAGGDPVFQSARIHDADAAAYWMPSRA